MSDLAEAPRILQLIYDQTPPILRWLLGVLSLGGVTLVAYLWRRRQQQIDDLHARIDREISETNRRLLQNERLLVQIAARVGAHIDE